MKRVFFFGWKEYYDNALADILKEVGNIEGVNLEVRTAGQMNLRGEDLEIPGGFDAYFIGCSLLENHSRVLQLKRLREKYPGAKIYLNNYLTPHISPDKYAGIFDRKIPFFGMDAIELILGDLSNK